MDAPSPPGGLLLGPCVSASPVLILAQAVWPTNLIFLAGKRVVSVVGEVDGAGSRSPLH
jgi:hypothetical protein